MRIFAFDAQNISYRPADAFNLASDDFALSLQINIAPGFQSDRRQPNRRHSLCPISTYLSSFYRCLFRCSRICYLRQDLKRKETKWVKTNDLHRRKCEKNKIKIYLVCDNSGCFGWYPVVHPHMGSTPNIKRRYTANGFLQRISCQKPRTNCLISGRQTVRLDVVLSEAQGYGRIKMQLRRRCTNWLILKSSYQYYLAHRLKDTQLMSWKQTIKDGKIMKRKQCYRRRSLHCLCFDSGC